MYKKLFEQAVSDKVEESEYNKIVKIVENKQKIYDEKILLPKKINKKKQKI